MTSLRSSYQQMKVAGQPKPPAHLRPMRQILEDEKLGASHAARMVNALLDSKAWVKKQFVVASDTGLRRIWHYGPKSPAS